MSVRSAQNITHVFTTRTPATSAATNADSLPTGALYVNGTADAATVTITNLATGIYSAAVTLPTLAIGDVVDLRVTVVMATVIDNAVIWQDSADILLDSNGKTTDAIQTGDSFVRIGAAGSGLTALGDTRLANLDAAVSSRGTSTYAGGNISGITGVTFPASVGDATAANQTTINSNVLNRATQSSLDALVTTVGVAGDGLTAVDDAVLAAIAALNNVTAAAVATAVEAAILDEGDATALLAAIAAKVEAFLINEGDSTATLAAIATAVRTNLAIELARIDATVSSRLATVGYTAPPSIDDLPTNAELAASQAASDDATLAAIAALSFASQASVDAIPTNAELATALAGLANDTADEVETRSLTVGSFGAGALAQIAATAEIYVETPTVNAGTLTLTRGDDYLTADGRQVRFINTAGGWPNLTGATATLVIRTATETTSLADTAIVVPVGANQEVTVDITSTESALIAACKSGGGYELTAILASGSEITLQRGKAIIYSQIA